MSLSEPKRSELNALIDAVCEDRVTPTDAARLEALLVGDSAAQQWYLRHVHLHGLLKWELAQEAEWRAVKQLKDRGRTPHAPREVHHAERDDYTVTRLWRVAAASLVPVLAAVLLVMLRTRDVPPTPPADGVVLAHVIDAEWTAEGNAVPQVGAAMTPQTLRLAAGVARLDFADGASVTLEGPAEFTVVDARRGLLHRGRLTAKVPPAAIGFRIDTPSLVVVDLGTAFGLVADENGSAEVQVFDGEVVVSPAADVAGSAAAKRRVGEGTAVRVEAGRTAINDARFDGSEYRRTWPVAWGVLAATGAVKFVEPRPRLVPRTYEDDAHLIVFPERESTVLPSDVKVGVRDPGDYAGPFDPARGELPAGTRVRSYLVQFNPVGRNDEPVRAMQGSVTFDRPVVGLVCTTKELNDGDAVFGKGADWRPGRGGGGIEAGDRVVLSPDRRTLTVELTAAAANDQIRVLVELLPAPNVVAVKD